jgi:hypothetical protein
LFSAFLKRFVLTLVLAIVAADGGAALVLRVRRTFFSLSAFFFFFFAKLKEICVNVSCGVSCVCRQEEPCLYKRALLLAFSPFSPFFCASFLLSCARVGSVLSCSEPQPVIFAVVKTAFW